MIRSESMAVNLDEWPPEGLMFEASNESARAMVGTYLQPEGPFLQQMNQDTMRNFCNGIGDRNPLFRDVEYGHLRAGRSEMNMTRRRSNERSSVHRGALR